MKLRLLSLATTTVVLAFQPASRAADEKAPPSAAKPAHDHEETELDDKMSTMNSAYRKLGRQINDASKNEDSLKLVGTIRKSAEEALKLEPARKADVAPADQEKFVANYRAGMKRFIAEVVKLEEALKANDNAAAAKLVDSMKAMQKEGHRDFKRQDKKT